jgi:uncharacterized protein YbbC (DUF1343 family)
MTNPLIIITMALALTCSGPGTVNAVTTPEREDEPSRTLVKTGIEVLRDRGFDILQGKRVGLVTNPSGVDRNLRSTIDILYSAPGVRLTALFGPEHGVRGDVYAGGKVSDGTDPATSLPVYSLYGQTKEPTAAMLEGLDVMVYDIQDVGSRSYTFISTLGLVMRACAKAGVKVVVLDRPNPLGGNKVEGCLVEDGFHSFISQFKIPYIYGLTVGELAMLINEEGLNRGISGREAHLRCDLEVVPMEGWTRDMLYTDTGLPWVLPSPNVPSPRSAICYTSAGIAGDIPGYLNIGVGYTIPFETFAAEWIDADSLKELLDSYDVPGTAFRTVHYKPTSGPMAGKLLHGVQYFYTDYESAHLTLTQFWVLQAVHKLYPERNPFESSATVKGLDRVCGTDYVILNFRKNFKVSDIQSYWTKDEDSFGALSKKYYLYK